MTLPGPWSYSSLKKFKTCPKQFAEVKVFRNFKEPEFTEATLYGKEFHTAAEKYIRDGTRCLRRSPTSDRTSIPCATSRGRSSARSRWA
jgi:hypothetical protein